jgi:hypothetical protein
MKIVLSRKGFDTQYGKVPNAILPDGTLIAFPIRDGASIVRADAIQRGGEAVGEMVEQLTRGRIRRDYRAHLDPDLDPSSYPREPGWRPVLGQKGSPLGHLLKQKVGAGDLFLFFGWFGRVEKSGATWTYTRGCPPVHLLWGWLNVASCLDPRNLPDGPGRWLAYHPHLHYSANERHALYVASDRLAVAGRLVPGGGIFPRFSDSRVLSAPGENMSLWRVPRWMHPDVGQVRFSYIHDATRWRLVGKEGALVQSIGKGQEIVMGPRETAPIDQWLARLFEDVPSVPTQGKR